MSGVSTHLIMEFDIEAIEDIHAKYDALRRSPPAFTKDVGDDDIAQWGEWVRRMGEKPKHLPNSYFLKIARAMANRGDLTDAEMAQITEHLRVARGKSHSGVLVITIFTSPYPTFNDPVTGERKTQSFSCQWNCYYCPNQPQQPRSYLEGEPGVLRANQFGFDCRAQMRGRMKALYDTGHDVDKLEVLILGGTWESYPVAYREEYIRDLYYAANTFQEWLESPTSSAPEPMSLDDERRRNRDAPTKIIGLTIETRPDTITPASVAQYRRYGCTRVQIGVQHLDDAVLTKINRKCLRSHTEHAIALLKDWGFKIDAHFMPNLPGASPALDRWMLVDMLLGRLSAEIPYDSISIPGLDVVYWNVAHPELQTDQWKVYPCETTPFTVIEKWYKSGKYMPYPETDLVPILLDMKSAMYPWIRLNRIVRDIPRDYIMASGNRPNLRQDLALQLKQRGQTCPCIRCREVKRGHYNPATACYRARVYASSGGTEWFLSCEDRDTDTLYGFLRLRIPSSTRYDELPFTEHAWIRELHVYGLLKKTHGTNLASQATQHRGIGKTLMAFAEEIVRHHSLRQCVVIAGEGTKRYYEKLGYCEGTHGYMIKSIAL